MSGRSVATYYWNVHANFGDGLAPLLLQHFTGVTPVWSSPSDAEIVVTGSVIDVLPDGWQGIVAGAGTLHERTCRNLNAATVLAVRGSGTQAHTAGAVSAFLGDPGLLASELAPAERGRYQLGIVPHWTDTTLFNRFKHLDPILIPASTDPLEAVRLIGSCKKIVSSSLHGIIVADSFGIPRRAERFPKMDSPHEGGTWKFDDYATSIAQPIEWGKKGGQVAPLSRVEAIKYRLFEMFQRVAELLS